MATSGEMVGGDRAGVYRPAHEGSRVGDCPKENVKTSLVITVGSRLESLGAMKLANWLRRQGYAVEEANCIDFFIDAGKDLYCFSVVFSWNIRQLVEWVRWAKTQGEVWIGGPAVSFSKKNAAFVRQETGIEPTIGIDDRFERESGTYPMTYFSRGCPAYNEACGSCPVPALEGSEFRFYPDACPAKLLLDNNLSALPDEYQEHIIRVYAHRWEQKRGKVDANSGFEPHTFTDETVRRWKRFPLSCWRFGYDGMGEREQALEMMRLLRFHGFTGEKVRVYTIIGNEPIGSCHQRIREVIAEGCHPWPQRRRPLSWLGGPLPCLHDWDEQTLIAYQHFYSRAGYWKKIRPETFFYQGRYPLRAAA